MTIAEQTGRKCKVCGFGIPYAIYCSSRCCDRFDFSKASEDEIIEIERLLDEGAEERGYLVADLKDVYPPNTICKCKHLIQDHDIDGDCTGSWCHCLGFVAACEDTTKVLGSGDE